MEMESNDSDSDCIITDVVESRGKVLKINEKESFLERCQLECEGFSIKSIPGMVTVKQTVLRHILKSHSTGVLDRLDTLLFTKISLNLMKMTERRYNNSTVDTFFEC